MDTVKIPSRGWITHAFKIIIKWPKRSAIIILTHLRKNKCILWRQLCIFSFNPIIMVACGIIIIVFIYPWIVPTISICVIKYIS